jgi:hypothetical protein
MATLKNSVRSTNIVMADLRNNVEYTLQYRSNKLEFLTSRNDGTNGKGVEL